LKPKIVPSKKEKSKSLKGNFFNFPNASFQPSKEVVWERLFVQPRDPNCGNPLGVVVQDDGVGVTWKQPMKKPNVWDRQNGFGQSSYFFDYLDEILQKDVSLEFQKLFERAKKVKVPIAKEMHDPYSLEKMVNNMAPEITPHGRVKYKNPNDPKLIDKLSTIVKRNKKVFNARAYRTAITVPQLSKIVQDWHWEYNPSEDEWARKLLDKYDFDGDGRLNAREFIFFSIRHNRRRLGSKNCDYCYYDIVHKKIDPLYNFMDCTNSNKISAEDIWGAFQHLRKSSRYNIYNCHLNHKKYRTSAMNDFVLKNMHSNDGSITREEFRIGILLGYWDRQTSPERVLTNDAKTFKSLRWDNKGMIDIVCHRLMGQVPKKKTCTSCSRSSQQR